MAPLASHLPDLEVSIFDPVLQVTLLRTSTKRLQSLLLPLPLPLPLRNWTNRLRVVQHRHPC